MRGPYQRSGENYRPALDGVRAVAVLAVIAYHVSDGMRGSPLGDRLAELTSGGFLGVDVFFVLSGYLITSILFEERFRAGGIRLRSFWLRRARRLLPALLLLLVVVAVVTAASTPAVEASARRDDVIATLFYFANWHFIASDASYFAGFLGASPLRHAWSLAIEEQFYLAFPLVVVVALRMARRVPHAFCAAALLGAVVSTLLMARSFNAGLPSDAYYGTLTHAAPLLVGVALAAAVARAPGLVDSGRAQRIARWFAPVSVVLLAVGFLTFDDQEAFYYEGGLLAFSLAAAAVIWSFEAHRSSAPARLLSTGPMVWIGTISYGLYLWHWPLGLWLGEPTGNSLPRALLIVAATVAVASLSYYLLERPVRMQRFPAIGPSPGRLAAATVLLYAIVASMAISATQAARSDPLTAQVDDTSYVPCPPGSPGFDNDSGGNPFVWCRMSRPSAPDAPTIASVGDSTSTAMTPGLRAIADERGWGYVQAGQSSCSLLPAAFIEDPDDTTGLKIARACVHNTSRVLAGAEQDYDPDVWIVADHVIAFPAVLPTDEVLPPGSEESDRIIVKGYVSRLEALTADGDQVILFEILPLGPPVECAESDVCQYDDRAPSAAHANQLLREAAKRAGDGVVVVSIADLVCPQGECQVELEGKLIRPDGTHFSGSFSELIGPEIIRRAQNAGIDL